MKDINELTKEEREKIFKLMKPIGCKEGDKYSCAVIVEGIKKPVNGDCDATV